MIKWIAGRIHAAWLDANYDWLTVERDDGRWEAVSTTKLRTGDNPALIFDTEDKAEAFIDRHCATRAAVHVLCFWRKKP